MKEQRWDDDYETLQQEFKASWNEEAAGMRDVNRSFGNDYITMGDTRRLDMYETDELEPSWSMQLDVNGRQPHAREYLEYDLMAERGGRKFTQVAGQHIDHCDGIQFSGRP